MFAKVKYFFLMLFSACFGDGSASRSDANQPSVTAKDTTMFYQFKMETLEGDTIDFSKYRGKKVLIVNTASECGYTPQYAELQQLHEKYGDKVTILGFPCNDFGGQEPGSSKEIGQFCQRNYGVTFQMFAKITTKGDAKPPLYEWLTNPAKNGWNSEAPKWNFAKYLVDENGALIRYYPSGVNPMGKEIIGDITK